MIQKAERSNEVIVCFVREVHIGHTAKSVLVQSVLGGNEKTMRHGEFTACANISLN